jgi:RNA polymerase sigma-70 factor, ECF subfamily
MDNHGNDPPEKLLHGLALGDQRAFTELYDLFGVRLYRTALGILRRREDAEDAVQEVFTALVRSRKGLTAVNDLTAYMFSALRRAAARCAERQKHEPASSQAVEDIEARKDLTESSGQFGYHLEQALQKLPDEQREVISLKIDGQLTFAQIADVLGISINTAASRYRYALEKLRATL